MKKIGCVAVILLMLNLGCYYKVTDVASGKEYVTDGWNFHRSGWNKSAELLDMKTGRWVTLQSYEFEQIPSEDAKAQVASQKN